MYVRKFHSPKVRYLASLPDCSRIHSTRLAGLKQGIESFRARLAIETHSRSCVSESW